MQIRIPVEPPYYELVFELHDSNGNLLDYSANIFEINMKNGKRISGIMSLTYEIEDKKLKIKLPPLAKGHYTLSIVAKSKDGKMFRFIDATDIEVIGSSDNPTSRNYGDEIW